MYCHKKKGTKTKKNDVFVIFFVCYKKTCVMGQNDSYMNQERETKEKTTCRKERGMGMFPVSKKKTVVFSSRSLICLQKSVFTPPPPVAVSLAGWVPCLRTLAPSQCCTGCRVRNSEGWKG